MPQVPPELAGNPDRLRWNERYGSGPAPTFRAHEVARLALAAEPPDGPVLELACGPSGSALLAAERGRGVTAVDVSEVALDLLVAEARRRHLEQLISVVQADLTTWQPPPRRYAVVLCSGYWDRGVFAVAAGLVAPGGCLGWQALTQAAREADPRLPAEWCVAAGEPASLLPPDFAVISQHDARRRRVLLARRQS
ncbi:MAG TPA: class I SAM-dependent methyltransferase [Streptosporangiaceae bacterium]|nr:class I SAM-dependent methyltransferase [Streptosporangiaceae bacterium]